jgi:hypothetical protein
LASIIANAWRTMSYKPIIRGPATLRTLDVNFVTARVILILMRRISMILYIRYVATRLLKKKSNGHLARWRVRIPIHVSARVR